MGWARLLSPPYEAGPRVRRSCVRVAARLIHEPPHFQPRKKRSEVRASRGVSPGPSVAVFSSRPIPGVLVPHGTWHSRCATEWPGGTHRCCSQESSLPHSWAPAAPSSPPIRRSGGSPPMRFIGGAARAARPGARRPPRRGRPLGPRLRHHGPHARDERGILIDAARLREMRHFRGEPVHVGIARRELAEPTPNLSR